MKIMERIQCIRGAITVEENTLVAIKNASTKVLREIIEQNKLNKSDMVNIMFTMTDDLDEVNPATCVRETLNINDVPILCSQEMKVKNTMPMCIRVMVTAYTPLKRENIKHAYIGKAESLRPDLKNEPTSQHNFNR